MVKSLRRCIDKSSCAPEFIQVLEFHHTMSPGGSNKAMTPRPSRNTEPIPDLINPFFDITERIAAGVDIRIKA